MSRRQKQEDRMSRNSTEECELDMMGDTPAVNVITPESAEDMENSYQNHMVIYDEDIDDMLDELDDDDWEYEDDDDDDDDSDNEPNLLQSSVLPPSPNKHEPVMETVTGSSSKRYSDDFPEPPDGSTTPPGCHRIRQEISPYEPPSPPPPPPPPLPSPPGGIECMEESDHDDEPEPNPPEARRITTDHGPIEDDGPVTFDLTLISDFIPKKVVEYEPYYHSDAYRQDIPRKQRAAAIPAPTVVITSRPFEGDDDSLIGSPTSPPAVQPLPRLMGSRAPMSVPVRHHAAKNIEKSSKLSSIKSKLQKGRKGAEEVFDILIRSVKLKKDGATMRILQALEKSKEDLCNEKYREKNSTASLLHIALLFKRTDLCKKLIEMYPELLKSRYTSKDYRNQNCFHIAAANDENNQIMYFMLDRVTDQKEREKILNSIADGNYFVEERPEASTCLSAAVWTGQVAMINTLVQAGADLGLFGIDGNTLLHYIIYLSTTGLDLHKAERCIQEVYNCCDIWWSRQHQTKTGEPKGGQKDQMRFDGFCNLLSIKNYSGLIPAALAVSIHSPLTPFLLSFEPIYRLPQAQFGTVAWATYDVTDIVSYKPKKNQGSIKSYDCSSVFHILAHTKRVLSESGTKQKDVAELEPISSAIKMKWSVFRWIYVLWCLVHAAYMITLTTVVLHLHKNKPNDSMTYSNPNATGPTGEEVGSRINKGLFGLFLIIPVFYIIFEIIDLTVSWSSFRVLSPNKIGTKKSNRRLETYLINNCTITGNAPYRLLAFCFSLCMFVWYVMFLLGDRNCVIPLSLSLILGWIFMLNFTRACRHVCRFSIMIQKMFFRDFLYFITVYMFILVAFSTALHLIFPPGLSVGNTVVSLLNIVTNAGDTENGAKTQKHYAAAVMSMYAILSVILLLNMLIAMMNTSYEAVKSSKTNLWRYQQLSILLMIERRFIWWRWLCVKSQSDTYSPQKLGRIFLDVTEEKIKC